jgi:hypothetical protein
METFRELFGSLLAFAYHCFGRVVMQGYLPLLTREEHIVHFFGDVHHIYPISKQALRQRNQDCQHWVEAFARKHRIPIQWPDKDMKKKDLKQEDYVRLYGLAMERQKHFGVYFIFKVMEGPSFRSCLPHFPTQDDAVGTPVAQRPPQSGGTVARSGLRMMPTFPPSPYHSVRRVFPSTAGRLACQTVPSRCLNGLKPAPGICQLRHGLHPSFAHLVL